MVRLREDEFEGVGLEIACFNSKMVRLRVCRLKSSGFRLLVSIPKWCDWECCGDWVMCFIQRVSIPKWCDWEEKGEKVFGASISFQFQNGAIESNTILFCPSLFSCFNSKMVRLREKARSQTRLSKSFNSKMVRLRACLVSPSASSNTSFNSKMVRLRAAQRVARTSWDGCFNSKMVRLRVVSGLPAKWSCQSFNSKMVRLRGPAVFCCP